MGSEVAAQPDMATLESGTGLILRGGGRLEVAVANPQDYWAFDTMSTEQILATYEQEDKAFMAAESVLPKQPHLRRVRDYLDAVRTAHLTARV